MSHYYSKTTNSFYHSQIHSPLPGDAVLVTDEEYQRFISAGASNKMVRPNEDGFPILVDKPEDPYEEIGMTREEYIAHVQANFPMFAQNICPPAGAESAVSSSTKSKSSKA